MDISTIKEIVELIIALIGLIGAGVGAYFAVKNWVAKNKEKTFNEKLAMLKTVADASMKEAEASGKSGADKKTMVMNAIKEACKAAGLNVDLFINQLSDYIDSSIDWFNGMKK